MGPTVHDAFRNNKDKQAAALLLCALNDVGLMEAPVYAHPEWLPAFYPGWDKDFEEWICDDLLEGGVQRQNEVAANLVDALGSDFMVKTALRWTSLEERGLSTTDTPAGQEWVDMLHQDALGFAPTRCGSASEVHARLLWHAAKRFGNMADDTSFFRRARAILGECAAPHPDGATSEDESAEDVSEEEEAAPSEASGDEWEAEASDAETADEGDTGTDTADYE